MTFALVFGGGVIIGFILRDITLWIDRKHNTDHLDETYDDDET